MTFGQQPQGNNANGFNGQPYGQNQYNPNQNSYGQYSQNPYGQNQYQYAPQNMYAQGAPAATIPAQATYSYERAEHASVTRAYGEMTIGLLVTAAVAILTQATGAYIALIQSLGVIGAWAPFVVEIVIAIYLGARIEKIKPSTARVMFYVYAAIMGFSLSTIFMAYDLGTIGISLALCAGFFFALTMLGMTTKVNMLKAGPILLVGLIVLIVAEVLLQMLGERRFARTGATCNANEDGVHRQTLHESFVVKSIIGRLWQKSKAARRNAAKICVFRLTRDKKASIM